MFGYNNDLEEIRQTLDCQYFFDEAPGVTKNEVPQCFARLDKMFKGFLDLPLSEKVKEGKELINKMADKFLERKSLLVQEVYPKLQELSVFLYKDWMIPEYFPAEAKEKAEFEALGVYFKAQSNKDVKTDNRTIEEAENDLNTWKKEFQQKEKERYRLFIKFYDLLNSKKDFIKEIVNSINENSILSSWWVFQRTNELFEAVSQHKKDANADVDKSLIVDLLGFGTLAKSLYWNAHFIENELQNIKGELAGILSLLQWWPDVETRKREANDEKNAQELNKVIQFFYQKHDPSTYSAFFTMVLKIWDAEQMLVRELKPIETIVSLPDKIRENLQKIQNEAIKGKGDKNKLRSVKELATHYNTSPDAIYKWKNEQGAPFHGTKARISELDQWRAKKAEKRSQSAKERYERCHRRTSKK